MLRALPQVEEINHCSKFLVETMGFPRLVKKSMRVLHKGTFMVHLAGMGA